MKYKVKPSNKFKKDLKLMQKRGYDIEKIRFVINELAKGNTLPEKYNDHQLTGFYRDKRECHILPDWLLIYKIKNDELILYLIRTGSHSDLF